MNSDKPNYHNQATGSRFLLAFALVFFNVPLFANASSEMQNSEPTLTTPVSDFRYPAILEPVDRVVIQPRVTGYLESIDFAEGSYVNKGDALFSIDARTFNAHLEAAKAGLQLAEAEAEQAKTESERANRLQEKHVISVEEAQRRNTKARVANANVGIAKAQLREAQLNVDFAKIRAPVSGYIGRAQVTPGNLVSPQNQLALLVRHDKLHIAFDIGESDLIKLNSNHRDHWQVHFSIPGSDMKPVVANINILDSEIKLGTGTVRVRAEFNNEQQQYIPGMYGAVSLFQFEAAEKSDLGNESDSKTESVTTVTKAESSTTQMKGGV